MLVSDSEYAIDAMLGLTTPNTNKVMVAAVRRLWARAREQRRARMFVRHVHSHARGANEVGHEWNERADALAHQGAHGTVWGVGPAWAAYPPPPPPPRRAHLICEAERVARCAHAFGVLNVPVPVGRLLPPAEVDWLYRRVLQRLRTGVSAAHHRRREAESRLWAARTLLRRPADQRRLRDSLVQQGLRPITRTVACTVDVAALRHYVATAGPEADEVPRHSDGRSYGATRREMVQRLLGHVHGQGSDGLAKVTLKYRHSRLGAGLVAAGHVLESREYPVHRWADPFSLPRAQRAVALGRSGVDFDDEASFPRAKAACVAPCRRMIGRFLKHREVIMGRMGDYALGATNAQRGGGGGLTAKERRKRVKALFNSLDMDGTLGAWRTRMGLRDGERPLRGFVVDLGRAGEFRFDAYRRVQAVGTQWLARHMPAMLQFVTTHLRDTRDNKRLEHPERTLASYVFQEAEGVSRAAKLWWARVQGHTVQNLQHDGAVLQLARGVSPQQAARELSRVCSHALGYEQPVVPE